MNKFIQITAVLLLLLYGCGNPGKPRYTDFPSIEKDKNHKTVKFDLTVKEPVVLGEMGVNIGDIGIIKDMDIINLDCEEVFSNIDKIIRYRNRIYIMDNSQTYSIYIFDISGNFVGSISRQGQGPEEYVQLSDIFIDSTKSTLNVVSRVDKKILEFDLDGKQCLKIKKTPLWFSEMAKVKNGYLGYAGNSIQGTDEKYSVYKLSDRLELKGAFFEIDRTWNSKKLGGGLALSSYNGKIHYITPMDFNIYSIEDDKVSIAYTFDFGDAAWPQHLKEWREPDEIRDYIMRKVRRFYRFQETDSHLIADIAYMGQRLICVYDKKSDRSYVTRPYINDGRYFISFGEIVGIDKNAIYTKLDAPYVKTMWTGKNEYNDFWPEHSEQIMRLREKFPTVNEEGNPFLLIYYLK
ncbi:MAG: 6-bladed beta-propeller [Prevotellaceae bacterium]|jgi:hypothetical protein|nr:6-bladed beta-propeller [Prevotellaceae bacterium]